jgi:UDP-N-acetylmuramoyl-tripeptide--D-alanyl-D-alanine ligase
MKLTVRDMTSIPHIEVRRLDEIKGRSANGVSTDSRTVQRGNLFFALRGDTFDGHEYVDRAHDAGALVAVVDREGAGRVTSTMPLIVVEDTTAALGKAAELYRRKFDLHVLGIAGSNGKTTTKDMVAAVLAEKYCVLKTEGNLNNHIGVPQTLFRLERKHEVAVIEMGTNHPGELEYLCTIARPTMGLLTSIGREHLEFFKDLEGVEEEETSLFRFLERDRKAVAFVNGNEPRISRRAGRKLTRFSYGFHGRRDVRGRIAGRNAAGCATLEFSGGTLTSRVRASLNIAGEHNALNALAAAAVGLRFRVPAKSIVRALEHFTPSGKRMERSEIGGATILNDAYNANPDSMLAALKALAETPAAGKRIAVLGDMKELGDAGAQEHTRIGEEIGRLGIRHVLGFGELTKRLIDAVGSVGALHFTDKRELAAHLLGMLAPGDVVLLKGSRSMKLEDIAAMLREAVPAGNSTVR